MLNLEVRDHCAAVPVPGYLPVFTATVSGLLSLVAVPCNIFVCLTIMKSSPQFKSLRTPFTYFILNLAATDLLIGAATEPVSVVYHFMEACSVTSLKLIKILHVLYFLPCTVSVFSILALTLERCFAISKPLKYRQSVNNSRVLFASGIIWLLSAIFLAPYFYLGYRTFAFFFANSVILLTICVSVTAYLKIIKTIRHRKKFRKESLQGLCIANRKATIFEEKLTNTFTSILILFGVCYVIPCILMYLMNLCTHCSCDSIHWLRDTSFLGVTLNSAINPFLYAWRLPSFRRALRTVIPGCESNLLLAAGNQPEVRSSLRRTSVVAVPLQNGQTIL